MHHSLESIPALQTTIPGDGDGDHPEDSDGASPESHHDPSVAPDGGYGWVIVAAVFLNNLLVSAHFVSTGVYLPELSEYFQKSQASMSILVSLESLVNMALCLFVPPLVNKFGERQTAIMGSVVSATAVLASSFAQTYTGFVIMYAVIKPSGRAFLLIPCNIMVQKYFNKRRPFAAGLSSAGLSSGSLVFSPLHRLMIETYGWRGGLLLFAGIAYEDIVFAALLRPLPSPKSPDPPEPPPESTQESSPESPRKSQGSPPESHQKSLEASPKSPRKTLETSPESHRKSLEDLKVLSQESQDQSTRKTSQQALSISAQASPESPIIPPQKSQEPQVVLTKKSQESLAQDTAKVLTTDNSKAESPKLVRNCDINPSLSVKDDTVSIATQSPDDDKKKAKHYRSKLKSFGAKVCQKWVLVFILSKALAGCGVVGIYKYSVSNAILYGIDPMLASFLPAAIGIGSTVSRLLTGLSSNAAVMKDKRVLQYSAAITVNGLVVVLASFGSTAFWYHLMCCLLFGLTLGSHEGLVFTVTADLFGLKRLAAVLSYTTSVSAAFVCGVAPIIGYLCDVTGTFRASLILAGGLEVAGGLAAATLLIAVRDVKTWDAQLGMLKGPRRLKETEAASVPA